MFQQAAAGLAPGDVIQNGSLNSIEYSIGPALLLPGDNNRFAFRQDGSGNAIEGSTNGSNNEVVVSQNGIQNFTSFVQVGNANVIGVNQGTP